jgi:hypothetical protein
MRVLMVIICDPLDGLRATGVALTTTLPDADLLPPDCKNIP